MHYVLDTGFFVLSRGYYPDTFPSFWEKLTEVTNNEIVSSVSEVLDEIKNYGGQQEYLLKWVNKNKTVFQRPGEEEQRYISQIMEQFPQSLSKKRQLEGGPWADPFIIAKAQHLSTAHSIVKVVTSEQSTKGGQNIIKIPDICESLRIKCISPQEFMKDQKWSF